MQSGYVHVAVAVKVHDYVNDQVNAIVYSGFACIELQPLQRELDRTGRRGSATQKVDPEAPRLTWGVARGR